MRDEVMNDLHEVYTDPNPDDLIRVIRCRNCKYGETGKNGKVIICKLYLDKHLKFPHDYCSDAELKEADK